MKKALLIFSVVFSFLHSADAQQYEPKYPYIKGGYTPINWTAS
jgi:hypothetical protein